MSDDWDFYLCHVDDQPASIFLDLGIASEAPLPQLPHLAWVRVTMRAPRADGLSSSQEFETLSRLEDHVTGALVDGSTVYVGRNTSGGCRDFHYYVADPAGWDLRVAAATAAFPEYEVESGSHEDATWQAYFGFLHPGPDDLQSIRNRRTCDALREAGDALTAPREIDHWAYFPDEASRDRFEHDVAAAGFTVRDRSRIEGSSHPYGVQLFRADTPSARTIDEVVLPLAQAAREHGGEYDGWECEVIE